MFGTTRTPWRGSFPQLERDLRRRTDFAAAMDPATGVINHRGEGAGLAVDGQAGCILRAYREHQMSADSAFLKELWPKIKLAMQCLVRMDRGDGLLDGPQHNTLDQPWFGKVAWLSSLYLAAARACEEMAREIGDTRSAGQMREISGAAAGASTASCSTASTMPTSPTPSTNAASGRTTAARSTRSSARAGRTRSPWAGSSPKPR